MYVYIDIFHVFMHLDVSTYIYITYIYVHIYIYIHIHIYPPAQEDEWTSLRTLILYGVSWRLEVPSQVVGSTPGSVTFPSAGFDTTIESRFGPKRGFGVTPGELLTIRNPNPYPKSEKPPSAERVHKTKSLKSPR